MSADTFLLCRNIKKESNHPFVFLMIARMLTSPAAVSFSRLPLCPSSAEQHRRIPHFASLSDNPASLFLFFCIHCKLPFSRKAFLQILHSVPLPSEFFHPAVLKMLPWLLCEEVFHPGVPHKISYYILIFNRQCRCLWSWNS